MIVDDELLACQLLTLHVKQMPQLSIVQICSSAVEAGKYLNANEVDLIFLDIEMPKLSGLEFLKSFTHHSKVILTTAHAEFALDAFELNVIDYLLKPITFDRFEVAVGKALGVLKLERKQKVPSQFSIEQSSVLIRSNKQLVRINLGDILYIEGLHKYVKIVTTAKTLVSLIGLSAMEDELPQTLFYRCQRSFIINLQKAEAINANRIIIGTHSIPMGKDFRNGLIERLGKRIR